MAPQDRGNAGEQLGGVERLDEVVVGPGHEPADPVDDVGPGGEEEERDTGGRGVARKLAPDLEAVRGRHHHVADHDVWLLARDLRQSVRPRGGRADLVARALHERGQGEEQLPLIVDQENGDLVRRQANPPRGRRGSNVGTSGPAEENLFQRSDLRHPLRSRARFGSPSPIRTGDVAAGRSVPEEGAPAMNHSAHGLNGTKKVMFPAFDGNGRRSGVRSPETRGAATHSRGHPEPAGGGKALVDEATRGGAGIRWQPSGPAWWLWSKCTFRRAETPEILRPEEPVSVSPRPRPLRPVRCGREFGEGAERSSVRRAASCVPTSSPLVDSPCDVRGGPRPSGRRGVQRFRRVMHRDRMGDR